MFGRSVWRLPSPLSALDKPPSLWLRTSFMYGPAPIDWSRTLVNRKHYSNVLLFTESEIWIWVLRPLIHITVLCFSLKESVLCHTRTIFEADLDILAMFPLESIILCKFHTYLLFFKKRFNMKELICYWRFAWCTSKYLWLLGSRPTFRYLCISNTGWDINRKWCFSKTCTYFITFRIL